jgi:hypothetical protein
MIKREQYMELIRDYMDNPMIKIIKGIRRSGKTELLKMIIAELKDRGVEDEQIIYLNYESLSAYEYKDFIRLYKYVESRSQSINKKVYVLLDEIQEVEFWEKAIRSIRIDFPSDIYITGSNAHLLSGELATLLSGRYIEFEMLPLSFVEFLEFYNGILNTNDVLNCYKHYMKYGGFPDLMNMKQKEPVLFNYLKGIYDTVVLRDVIERGNIRNPELLKRILHYVMDNIGQMTSGAKILEYLKGANQEKVSTTSLYNYIDGLENAMIIYSAKPYDIKGKRILKRSEKFYLADLGLRHAVMGYRENDISQLLENIVYLELRRRGYEIYVGKIGEYEVDFVAIHNNIKKYIQVTYTIVDENVAEREYRSLEKIDDNYDKYVISMDSLEIEERNGIKWRNLIDFLCNER